MDALTWFKGLLAAVIGGSATALTAIGGASAFGSPLNWTQISAVAISSAFFSACAYLSKSPVPDDVSIKSISFEPQKTTVTTTTIPQSDPIDK